MKLKSLQLSPVQEVTLNPTAPLSGREGVDARRGSRVERGYTYRWLKASKIFRGRNPLCAYCQREGRVSLAVLVDHIIPHNGDPVLFWDEKNWQSLCQRCHSSTKQREERSGVVNRAAGGES